MGLIKDEYEIDLMKDSCMIVSQVLKNIKDYIKPEVTTLFLNNKIEEIILDFGGKPAFKGYGGSKKVKPFPASACISIDDEVVHGIPSDRKLIEGEIVSIDVGVKKNGYFGDAAHTYPVGEISPEKQRLLRITEESLYAGISQAIDGNIINDISCTVQTYCEEAGFGVVRELVGHGIGSKLHEDPPVPNFHSTANTSKLKKGMTIAIEPMITYGSYAVRYLKDGWTVVTKDGKPSAHFEHTILITDSVPEILTKAEHNFIVKKEIKKSSFKDLMIKR